MMPLRAVRSQNILSSFASPSPVLPNQAEPSQASKWGTVTFCNSSQLSNKHVSKLQDCLCRETTEKVWKSLSSLVSLYVQTSALFYLFIVFLLVKTQHVLISRLFKKAK